MWLEMKCNGLSVFIMKHSHQTNHTQSEADWINIVFCRRTTSHTGARTIYKINTSQYDVRPLDGALLQACTRGYLGWEHGASYSSVPKYHMTHPPPHAGDPEALILFLSVRTSFRLSKPFRPSGYIKVTEPAAAAAAWARFWSPLWSACWVFYLLSFFLSVFRLKLI